MTTYNTIATTISLAKRYLQDAENLFKEIDKDYKKINNLPQAFIEKMSPTTKRINDKAIQSKEPKDIMDAYSHIYPDVGYTPTDYELLKYTETIAQATAKR
jgi:hypothetical protein